MIPSLYSLYNNTNKVAKYKRGVYYEIEYETHFMYIPKDTSNSKLM